MATAGMGLDLRLNASGNAEQKLQALNRQLMQSAKSVDELGRSQSRATSIALKQAASLGLLGHELGRLSNLFLNMSRTGTHLFSGMLQAGAELQRAKQGLSIFFGSKSESMAGALINISSETEIAAPKLIDIARKLGGLGLNQEQTVKGTRALASALSTLPAERQTRVLNSLGTTLNTANGLQRVFSLELTKTQKAQIQNLDGHARTIKILELLNDKFGASSKILSGGLAFQWKQLHNLVQKNILAQIALPAVNALSESFGKLVFQLVKFSETAEFQEKVIKPLSEVFLRLSAPIIKLIDYLTEHNTIPRFLEWLGKHETLVQMSALTFVIGTGMAGAFLALASSVMVASASILLFKRITLPQLSGMFNGGKTAEAAALKKAGKMTFANRAGGFVGRGLFGTGAEGATGRVMAGRGVSMMIRPFETLANLLLKIPRLFSMMGEGLLVALGAMISLAAVGGAVMGLFDAAKSPALKFIKDFAAGIGMAVDGMMQVLKTGTISEELFVRLTNSGFGPFFRIITKVALILRDIFVSTREEVGKLMPDFSVAFDVLKRVFLDVADGVVQVMQFLGILGPQSDQTGKIMGKAFGAWLVRDIKFLLHVLEDVAAIIEVIVSGVLKMMAGWSMIGALKDQFTAHTPEEKAAADKRMQAALDVNTKANLMAENAGHMWRHEGTRGRDTSRDLLAPSTALPPGTTVNNETGEVYLDGNRVGYITSKSDRADAQAHAGGMKRGRQ